MDEHDWLADLAAKIVQFIDQWNQTAHPFRWTSASFDTVPTTVEVALPSTSALPEAA